ncbi:hypothetical protein [Paenibacillus taichungensis]|uniref:hypothetical protein n=1 Tax=Paenibacillus taichungensis TaxID=484184 RepID=UPI001586C53C|nr:hypothetical protein [Paenibacillus taichungensis]MDR9749425.1 hypothetical protein [Paenibacillus taichungensis]
MECGALLQNSIDSIYAVPEAFIYLVARLDHSIVGYGLGVGEDSGARVVLGRWTYDKIGIET